jgi:ComF family protein
MELLFPITCVLCGAPGDDGLDLCNGCLADLPAIDPCCALCALPLPADVADRGTGVLCGACQGRAPPFTICRAAFRYQDPLPALIAGIKFRGRLNLLRLLGLLLARRLRETAADLPDRIVPVPLHPDRLRQRGYNQAHELARLVGRALAVPVDDRCCARVLATTPQSELDQKARMKNMRGAFSAMKRLEGLHLAVLDDVVTTGSTVSELARTLSGAGAARVDVWTIARTP